MSAKPKNVIILGMARSGTSLSASIFARQGYFIDADDALAATDPLNPKGYYESLSLNQLNAQILRSTGFAHDNTWIYSAITPAQIAKLDTHTLDTAYRNFLAGCEQRSPWVWKDPRLCYTLGCWWPLLAATNTMVLLIRRDPRAIFNSFVRAGWRKPNARQKQLTLERTEQHISNALRLIAAHDIPHICLHYEDFRRNPDAIICAISQATQLNLTTADLGYDDRFNHHTFFGKLGTRIDQLVSRLPKHWINRIKRIVPKTLLMKLYPERYEK